MAVYFEHPNGLPIELVDEAATVAALGAGQEHQLRLHIDILDSLPETLPLTIVVETENFGTIAKWPIEIPSNGDANRVMAARITDATPAMRLPTGKHPISFAVSDDRALNYAMVYVNGQKIAWHDAQDRRLGMQVVADIQPGQNIIVVIAEDDQGIRTRYQRIIKGDDPAAADAQDSNPPSTQ